VAPFFLNGGNLTRKDAPTSGSSVPLKEQPSISERTRLRGRPRKGHAPLIDADILKAATSLFGETGFDGTSVEAVAGRAGVSKRTLYMRYPDKKTLFRDVIDDVITHARRPDPIEFADMRVCLSFHIENFFMIRDDPGMRVISAMGNRSFQNDRELMDMAQELTHELGIKRIARTIADTAARSGLALHDPTFYAASLLDMAEAHSNRISSAGQIDKPVCRRRIIDRIVKMLLAGMLAEGVVVAG
jgi:AcrR family transcriptional regulator